MFTRISRGQLLAVTRWSTTDLDNRVHNNQVAFAFGLTLPVENGVYIGPDCNALLLSDAFVAAGFTRTLAAQFVRDFYEKWWHGLERIEWPQLFPPPQPMIWAPTKRALDEGITEISPDSEIYLAITKNPDGGFQAESGTGADILGALAAMMISANSAGASSQITRVNLRWVYEATLEAARQAGVDLGAPFTRPEGHPEHRKWYAAAEVHRAFALQRQKKRKPPGPPRKRGRPDADGSP
jgi:hypothetical protein